MPRAKPHQFVVIGHPNHKRVLFFQQALAHFGLPPAVVLSYSNLLAEDKPLAHYLTDTNGYTCLRIESPGQNFAVEKALIAAGAEIEDEGAAERISASAALVLPNDYGRILYPRQWYLGFRACLERWQQELSSSSSSLKHVMNHPADIALMFDKRLSHALCEQDNIPVAPCLGVVESYEQLRERMSALDCQRVFVKLAHGSSASGVVALSVDNKKKIERAFTSVERVNEQGETRLYNSRKIRRYTRRAEIADIINILCREGVHVEAWLPKAQMQGCPFDLRVLVIAGQARHPVVRLGRSPMTNLHLGGIRGDFKRFLAKVGLRQWQTMQRTCEAAAALFPRSLYCGVDLLITADWQQHAILEINAFGDLLPRLIWKGLDSYACEVKAVLEKRGQEQG